MFSSAVSVNECSTHPSSLYSDERYTDSTPGKHRQARVTRGKKPTLLDSPRLHQNWMLETALPKKSWHARQKTPSVARPLGYIPKNYEKKNSGSKGILSKWAFNNMA